MNWKVTVPPDGKLIDNGILPILIEWNKDQHPSKKLSDSSVSLNKISLYHQDPKKIKKIIFNFIKLDFIQVLEGPPKIELILTTQNGKIIID